MQLLRVMRCAALLAMRCAALLAMRCAALLAMRCAALLVMRCAALLAMRCAALLVTVTSYCLNSIIVRPLSNFISFCVVVATEVSLVRHSCASVR